MPFLDPIPEFAPAVAPSGVPQPLLAPTGPTLGETFGAAFRQDNPTVNVFRRMQDEQNPVEPNHNPMDIIRGTDYEFLHRDNFVGSRSEADTRAIMRRIDGENADREILSASGAAGFVAQAAAGIVDPTLLLPGGVVVRSVKGGYSVGRTALSVGIAAGVQTASQEAILQGLQETRTGAESAVAITSGALLGAVLGTGASALLTRLERQTLAKSLDADRAAIDAHATGVPARSMGAGVPGETGGFGIPAIQSFHRSPDVFDQFSLERAGVNQGASEGFGVNVADEVTSKGFGKNLYKVNVYADPEKMVSWHYGADQQPQAFLDILRQHGIDPKPDWEGRDMFNELADKLGGKFRNQKAASELLARAGLDGIAVDPTSKHYVIFDPNRVQIVERNGQPVIPPAAPSEHVPVSPGTTGSVGAAATDTRQLEMFPSIPGTKNLSVTRRTLEATDVGSRRIMADLAEGPYRFKENEQGVATTQGPAVDRLARMEMNGTRVNISDELVRQYGDYRFGQEDIKFPGLRDRAQRLMGSDTEGKMTFTEFKTEVGRAMQSQDRHEISHVSNAAVYIRGKLFDRWGDRAEKAIEGFQKLEPKEGESYFPHIWNKELVRSRRPEFTNNITDLFKADQDVKRGIQDRLRGLSSDLEKASKDITAAKDETAFAAATLRHDEIRGKIEQELGQWEGGSAQEAKTALKAREKYARDREAKAASEGKPAPTDRLKAADDTVDRVTNRILASNRDLSVEELRSRAQETVDHILGSPDGRLPYDMHMGGPRIGVSDGSAPARGSLAGRQLDVSNAWARDWIENDIEHVVAMHLRTVIPDTLLAERFGDVEMSNSFRTINENYANLIDKTKSEKERTRLGNERDAVIRDIAAVRDRVRHVFGWNPDLKNMARVANAAKSINNLTSMGMSAVSSIPDLAGTVFRYGITSSIRDGWAPFFHYLTGSDAGEWAKFKTEMRSIGIGIESAINARQHSLDDVMDVYRPQSRVERTLQSVSDKFFVANLLAPLTDTEKMIAAHVSVSNILRATKDVYEGKATKTQIGNLGESSIDPQMAGRIWQQFNGNGGEVRNGVHLPNTKDWRDQAAAEALNGAVARDTDIMVVTPGQEKPLWMSKPVISLIGQFKSFTAAATERIVIANIQRRDASALSGLVFSLGLGMLSYKVNAMLGGQKTSDRPQDWFKEAMSRSNLIGWAEDGNALASKMTRGSVDIYRMVGADKPLSRFASRSAADMLLGPTWGKIEALPKITGSVAGGEWSASDTSAVRRLMPFQNLFWLRGVLNEVEQSTNSYYNIPEKKEPLETARH